MLKTRLKIVAVLVLILSLLAVLGLPRTQSKRAHPTRSKHSAIAKSYRQINGNAYYSVRESLDIHQSEDLQSFLWKKLPPKLRNANLVFGGSSEPVSGLHGDIRLKLALDIGRQGGLLRVRRGDVSFTSMNTASIVTEPGGNPIPPVTGGGPVKRSVAVVLLDFFGDPHATPTPIPVRTKCTTKQAQDGMWYDSNSAAKKYLRASYDQFTFDDDADHNHQPDVFGPYPIPFSRSGACLTDDYAAAANAAALARGVDLSKFQHKVYVFPRSSNCKSFTGHIWDGLGDYGPGCGNSCRVFLNGGFDLAVHPYDPTVHPNYPLNWWNYAEAHELGHNLGLVHSVTKSPLGWEEYGDGSCLMGNGNQTSLNAPQRVKLGFIPQSRILDAKTSGDYELLSADMPGSFTDQGYQVLKVFRPNSKDYYSYYLSLRQQMATDSIDPSDSTPPPIYVENQLSIHLYEQVSNGSQNPYLVQTLDLGQTYSDLINKVNITLKQITGDRATVNLDFTEQRDCHQNVATLGLGVNGTSWKYVNSLDNSDHPPAVSVKLTNNDIGLDCRPRTFTVRATPPSGWNAVPDQSISLSAGSVRSVPFDFSSSAPANLSDGDYQVRSDLVDEPLADNAIADAAGPVVPVGAIYGHLILDHTVPRAIGDLYAQVVGSDRGYYVVKLIWTPPADAGGALSPPELNKYCIYRNSFLLNNQHCISITGSPIQFVDGPALAPPKFTDLDGAPVGQISNYSVSVIDAAGNSSPLSGQVRTGQPEPPKEPPIDIGREEVP